MIYVGWVYIANIFKKDVSIKLNGNIRIILCNSVNKRMTVVPSHSTNIMKM